MNIDTLISLVTTGLLMILVGIFCVPIIRDLTSGHNRQENHPPIEDLVKKQERWIQTLNLGTWPQVEAWKERFAEDAKLIDGFIIWGEPDLLDQVKAKRAELGDRSDFDAKQLRTKFLTPPSESDQTTLIEALASDKKNS